LSPEAANHPDIQLASLVARYKYDPLGYVQIAFPWGSKGTSLEHHTGPCPCQTQILGKLTEAVKKRRFDGIHPVRPIRIAVCSGHGIGKSACIGMIADWIRSCWPDSQGTATANTFTQLARKTWANIRKWQKLSITSHWFEATSELIYRPEARDEWFLGAQTCSEENSEAFAGQHAANSISYYINDECSTIPDVIFQVEDGGMTDGMPIQLLFGNPTQPLGKFARVMKNQEPGDWIIIRIDSRDCPFTNKEEIQEWIDAYGEDSDFVRVRVRGLAPRAAASQFISDDLVMGAQKRLITPLSDDPLVCGVDFAWGGDDYNTVRFRRGLDAKSIPPIRIPGEQTRKPEAMVGVLSEVLDKEHNGRKVEMLFMDSAGIAGPIAVRLRELGFKNIVEVNFMADSIDPRYRNVRSMIWARCKEFLERGSIDRSVELSEDLTAPQVIKHLPLTLEPKEAIIKRIGHSTDDGDALGLTFYAAVRSNQAKKERERKRLERGSSVVSAWS
jgi:hypothetical protein